MGGLPVTQMHGNVQLVPESVVKYEWREPHPPSSVGTFWPQSREGLLDGQTDGTFSRSLIGPYNLTISRVIVLAGKQTIRAQARNSL